MSGAHGAAGRPWPRGRNGTGGGRSLSEGRHERRADPRRRNAANAADQGGASSAPARRRERRRLPARPSGCLRWPRQLPPLPCPCETWRRVEQRRELFRDLHRRSSGRRAIRAALRLLASRHGAAELAGVRAIERVRNGLSQRPVLRELHHHSHPRYGLKRHPMRARSNHQCRRRDQRGKQAEESSRSQAARGSSLLPSRQGVAESEMRDAWPGGERRKEREPREAPRAESGAGLLRSSAGDGGGQFSLGPDDLAC